MDSSLTFMIGAYIITRMVSFLTRTGERAENTAVQYLALGTILVTVVVMFQALPESVAELVPCIFLSQF